MAGELKHVSVGSELTQSEFHDTALHQLDGQTTGDLIYASSSTQLSRLSITTARVLVSTGGVPTWSTTLPAFTMGGNVNANSKRITSLAAPVDDNDATRKVFVTAQITSDIATHAAVTTAHHTQTTVNGIAPAVTIAGAGNVTVSGSGSTITISGAGGVGGSHASTHEDGGADEISLASLSGDPADTINKSLFSAQGDLLIWGASGPEIIPISGSSYVLTSTGTTAVWQTAGTPGAHKDAHDPQDGSDPLDTSVAAEIAQVQSAGTGSSHSFSRADHVHAINHGISDNHIVTIDGSPGATNYAKFTSNGITGVTPSGMRTDLNVADGADVTANNAPQAHASSHQSGGGDSIKLDDLASPDDNTDLNVTTAAHGLVPKAPDNINQFLRGDGTWSTVSGVGVGHDDYAVHINLANEINTLTIKDFPEALDEMIIEDTSSGYNKKSVLLGALGNAIKLDDLATPDDNVTLNASTLRHGLAPKLSGSTLHFFRGDGTWASVSGVDATAIHVDTANEITGVTLKGTPAANDEIILEDSAASYVKKSATLSTIGAAIKLDDLATPDDNTDLNVSTTRHGLVPKAPNQFTQFLDGTGAWSSITARYMAFSMSDHSYTGVDLIEDTVGESVAFGNVVYLASGGKWWKAARDSEEAATNLLAIVVAATISADAAGFMALRGVIRDDSWGITSKGAPGYLSATSGGLTQDIPASGTYARKLGSLTSVNNTFYFNPDNTVIKVA